MERYARRSVLIVAVIGLLIVVNVLSVRYPQHWDLTAEKLFSLSDQSRTALAQLQEPVKIMAFLQEGSEESQKVRDLLDSYRYAGGDKVQVEIVDPVAKPSVAREYQIEYYNTLILTMAQRQRRVEPYNLFSPGPDQYSLEFRGEQAVTRAILELNRQSGANLYFLSGHGEGSLTGDFGQLTGYLQGEGYTAKTLDLPTSGQVPQDARLVVIAGPRRDLSPQESEQLATYVAGGGRLLVMLDPVPGQTLPELQRLMGRLGVQAQPTLVVDPERAFFMDALSPVPVIASHAITDKLISQNLGLVMPEAQSLAVEKKSEYQVQQLLTTSNKAWGETKFPAQRAAKDPEDIPGPLTLAVAVSKEEPAPAAEKAGGQGGPDTPASRPVAVLIGNSAFVRAQAIGFQGNADFLVNSVNWLLGEEGLISIRPKEAGPRVVELTPGAAQGIFYGTTVVVPLIILGLGAFVWFRRRTL